MTGCSVTFETVTQESARYGDAAERGWLGSQMRLREAVELFHAERDWAYIEPDIWPAKLTQPPRSFTDFGTPDHFSGNQRSVSLQLPESVTPSSAMRVARLVGCLGLAS